MEAILDATAHILAKEGLEGVTTNSIAIMAGVSIGSLYQYFPGREAVIAALVERYMDRQKAIVVMRLTRLGPESELRELGHELVAALVESRSKDPALHRVLVQEIPRVGRMAQLLDLHADLSELVTESLKSARVELRLERLDLDVFLLVHAVDAMVNALIFTKPAKYGLEDCIDEINSLVLNSLRIK
ncbi:MAG TPA: TetR/AcrR family transcriptional regulator [Bacteriovoracaceae bacterium]|nr:TetR/AcrR family transcriptional regulator [Bacteriovoracaceae bacterium]